MFEECMLGKSGQVAAAAGACECFSDGARHHTHNWEVKGVAKQPAEHTHGREGKKPGYSMAIVAPHTHCRGGFTTQPQVTVCASTPAGLPELFCASLERLGRRHTHTAAPAEQVAVSHCP